MSWDGEDQKAATSSQMVHDVYEAHGYDVILTHSCSGYSDAGSLGGHPFIKDDLLHALHLRHSQVLLAY